MKATAREIAEILSLLESTVQRLTAVCTPLDNERLQFKPDDKTWSANEILAHLRACVDVWGETIARMLAEDTPTLRHISPRTWLKRTDYAKLPFHDSFDVFAQQRRALLKRLKSLTFEEWSRGATIKERHHTVFTQARRMAMHEQGHCEQVEALWQGKG